MESYHGEENNDFIAEGWCTHEHRRSFMELSALVHSITVPPDSMVPNSGASSHSWFLRKNDAQ